MAATMDAIAATLTAGGRTETMHPYPAESIQPPCVVVGYPKSIAYDEVYARGSDKAEFPVWFVVPRNDPKTARDALSTIIAGASSIKDLLDGNLGGAVQTCRVIDCQPVFIDVGGVSYVAAEFTLQILS